MCFLLKMVAVAARKGGSLLALAVVLSGCQAVRPAENAIVPSSVGSLMIPVHHAWGGEARCDAGECRLVVVEHEGNAVALHRIDATRRAQLLDRVSVGYHPDSAKWLSDRLVVATVEDTQNVEIFDTFNGKLQRVQQIPMGFAPRDVHVYERKADTFSFVVSPYSGDDLVWVTLSADGKTTLSVQREPWCRSPRHPVLLPSGMLNAGSGIAVGCDRDFKLLFRPLALGTPPQKPTQISQFNNVPRQVAPSPSGRWLYVVQEQGGRNARVDTRTGAIQWISAPRWGAVSVLPFTDNLVAWGEGERVYLQQLDEDGAVLDARWLAVTGFPTQLQAIDLDGDGAQDLVVFNSAGEGVDVIFGPLWEKANLVSKK